MLCPTRGRVYVPIEVLKVQSSNGLYISVNAKLNYTSYVVFFYLHEWSMNSWILLEQWFWSRFKIAQG